MFLVAASDLDKPLRITEWSSQVGCETISEYADQFRPVGTTHHRNHADVKGCYEVFAGTPAKLVDPNPHRAGDESHGRWVQQFEVEIQYGDKQGKKLKLWLFEGAVEPVPEKPPQAKQ
jgi:hypothetical protein